MIVLFVLGVVVVSVLSGMSSILSPPRSLPVRLCGVRPPFRPSVVALVGLVCGLSPPPGCVCSRACPFGFRMGPSSRGLWFVVAFLLLPLSLSTAFGPVLRVHGLTTHSMDYSGDG